METLGEFIWKRLQDLTVREAEARALLDEIHKEREQLRRAALAAGIETDTAPKQATAPKSYEEARPSATIRKAPSIPLKQAALIVLEESGKPMHATDILAAINKKLDSDVPRTSLSPQLSRLKDDNLLELEGRIWRLTEIGAEAALEAKAQYEMFG